MRHCHVMSTSLKSWHEHRGLWHSGDIEYSTIKIYVGTYSTVLSGVKLAKFGQKHGGHHHQW